MVEHIKRVKIQGNSQEKSVLMYEKVKKKLEDNGFIITEDNPHLVISVGGDGTFINALKNMNFHTKPLYVGVHTGHLGFLQEINSQQVDVFIEALKNNDFKIEKHRIQETKVELDHDQMIFHSFNEVVIREENLKVFHIDIEVDGHEFERFSGDGVIISTPIGSTAYNMSAGGGIVFPSLDVLQLMPLAPLNSGAYRCLSNSVVVPPDKVIRIIPARDRDISICVDGELIPIKNVKCVESYMSDKYVKMLRLENYSFWTRIKEKFL